MAWYSGAAISALVVAAILSAIAFRTAMAFQTGRW